MNDDFDHAKVGALPDYDPAAKLTTMEGVLAFVHDIKATDEYATIVAMLEVAHTAAARIMEEELRAANPLNDRVAIKEHAMAQGRCKAEYVDKLCDMCVEAGASSCPFVPARK